jgi:PIN domain nuclease of toxin-antitoxin system
MIKSNLGKISFKHEWKLIIEREIENNGFRILPVTLEHTYYLNKLKPVHKDPFDRMLIAQAAVEDLIIITNDHFINSYEAVKTIW